MQTARIGIVILNWNNWSDTVQCVDSLRKSTRAFQELVIVDNGSADDSVARLKEYFSGIKDDFRVELITLPRNTGFTGGVNRGLEYLRERCDVFWMLNNDVLVQPTTLEILARSVLEEGHQIVLPKILVRETDPPRISYAGGQLANMHVHSPGRGSGEIDNGQYDTPGPVEFGSGCSLVFTRQALDQVGLLDQIFFAYGEDADWSFRARAAGIPMQYEPRALIYHGESGSTRKQNVYGGESHPIQYYLNVRSRLILLRRYTSGLRRLYSLCYFLAPYPAIVAYNLLRGRLVKARSIWLGVLDGFRSNLAPLAEVNESVISRLAELKR